MTLSGHRSAVALSRAMDVAAAFPERALSTAGPRSLNAPRVSECSAEPMTDPFEGVDVTVLGSAQTAICGQLPRVAVLKARHEDPGRMSDACAPHPAFSLLRLACVFRPS